MNKGNRVLVLMGILVILSFFIGPVSAESLNIPEVELAAQGVKNYTEVNGNVPGFVVVSEKNSTTPSFLNTLTKTTVQLNSGSTTPVTIATVNNPTGPSGSASGTLQKSSYVTMASNIQSFISSNGRAPNYASSSLGNVRYESLVYLYSKIINYYYLNGQLPSSVTVSNIVGVDATGVVIDNLPPSVNSNLAPGFYNSLKNVTLTASDNRDANPRVYYSLNNGTTWNDQIKTVTLNLSLGVNNLKYYARDASGNTGTTQSATYTIDPNLPNIDLEELEYAAGSVQAYLENEHQLPGNLTLSESTVTMAQFLKLTATAIINLNNNLNSEIPLEGYETALSPSETITTGGNLTKTDYLNLANSVKSYMDSARRAPDYQATSLGNMGYESLVYTFAQILKSYQVAQVLPNVITVRPWTLVTNNSTTFITMDQVNNAADTVQSYIETNHQLPGHVTIAGATVTMPQFLKLETTYLINAKENLYQSIPLGTYGTAPNPSESITGGDLNRTDYLNTAGEIVTFMDANGRVPNYKPTVRGYIRYESLVYIYSEIINSASRNQRLPDYITLTPWTTVTNPSTVFITMDQINTAVWTVKSNVESNHGLPSSLTITGRPITMPQFLKLETTSLKNIYAGLYQSIVLKSYGEPTSPSETLTSGKINLENYLNAANTIKSYMDTNGRAPNYSWTSQGNMRYEDLVYLYSQILNYYNVKGELPQYVTVHPWSVVSNPDTVTFNAGQIISGAETVTTYVEANHTLPSNVNISGTTMTMPQFLKLLTTTLHNINSTYTGQLVLGSYGLPTDTSETINGGILNQSQYLDLARDTEFFMYGDLRAPNYRSTSLGNICYQSLIYMYSQILSSYHAHDYVLPDFITVRPWSVVSNTNTKFFTAGEITNASKTVKSYLESNHILPSSVNISGTAVTMPEFLKLLTTAVSHINGKLKVTLALQSYSAATSPSETVTGGSLNSTAYLSLANGVISYMDSNGRAPDYSSTSLGNVRYESLVYLYSLILDYYGNQTQLPPSITLTPWSVVSSSGSSKFFTTEEIEGAAKTVQSHLEANHVLPSTVDISGTVVTMPQFLQLASASLLNVDGSLHTSLVLRSYNSASSPSETIIQAGNLTSTDYINLSNDILSYMYANGRAPDYRTISLGNMRYESLVYLYSQILSSHNTTGALPESITVHPWTVVANTSTVFVTTSEIKSAAETVKSYVDTNHALPGSVTISGSTVTMPQFLKLAAKAVLNMESYLYTSVILGEVGGPGGSAENMTSGTLLSDEFVSLGKNVLSYMDSHGSAPQYVNETSLGGSMGYESMVYMYSLIMSTYNATAPTPDQVYLVPWLAQANPNGTFNFRTQEIFSTIQAALDDADTVGGDTIWLRKTTYTENVVINKKITIRPVYGTEVTVEASDPNLPVFIINTTGNGTTIRDLLIRGATGSAGIYLNSSLGNYLLGNNLTTSSNGVHLFNSTENVISGNNILNNTLNGVFIDTGSDNEISSNTVQNNGAVGIRIHDSDGNRVYSNLLSSNQDGIELYNSSTTVHFNYITGNSRYGLYNEGNGTVNATNNWWGSNNPLVSSTSPSDIYLAGGSVTYDPWLVLSLGSSADRSHRTGPCYDYLITADLTHNNQGSDTSPDGTLPDEIPLIFNSTLGTVNTSGSTRKGRSEVKLTSTTAGAAEVSVSLDNQTVTKTVTITLVGVLGVYNTRTQEGFTSIQAAVDDPDTLNGDTITLADGTYTENVAINKKLTIKPVSGDKVTVKARDDDNSVFVLGNGGSGSTIQDLHIVSSSDSYGMALSHSYNNHLVNNTLYDSNRGLYLYLSGNNTLTGNTIRDGYYGIVLYNSTSNYLSGNTIRDHENGIYLFNSNYNIITGSVIADNYYGSYLYHSSNNQINNNHLSGNWVGVYLYDTSNNQVTGNNLTDNGAGITYHNSLSTTISGNNYTDNWLTDTSVIDDGEMVIATTIYSCGPAALATILKNLGIYTTEAELARLASTDETGTSLYGLKQAALNKGATAIGARLTIDQLQPNYLVVLNIDGTQHFEIIHNITNTTVYLYDPNLGDLEISREKFNTLYTGIALIINGQAPVNATILTDDEMRNIKAMYHYEWVKHTYWTKGYWYDTYRWVGFTVKIPYLYLKWVPGYLWKGWLPIPGHLELRRGVYTKTIGRWIRIPHYVPPQKKTYYTYEKKYDFNWDRVAAVVSIGGGGFLVGLSVIGDASTGGIGTVPAAYVAYSGITFITVGSTYLMMTWNEPWWK